MPSHVVRLHLKRDLIPAIFEFLLIILPIFIYVTIEAMHKQNWWYLLTSPEWAIASIFLSFQAAAIFLKGQTNTGLRINGDFLGLLFLAVITISIMATLNAYSSLHNASENYTGVIIRLAFLIVSVISFFIFVLSSKVGVTNE